MQDKKQDTMCASPVLKMKSVFDQAICHQNASKMLCLRIHIPCLVLILDAPLDTLDLPIFNEIDEQILENTV